MPLKVQFCSGTGIALPWNLEETDTVKRMKFLQKLLSNEDGQGLIEYTLIMFLVALVIWVAIKNTTVGNSLANNWTTITNCVSSPFSCGS